MIYSLSNTYLHTLQNLVLVHLMVTRVDDDPCLGVLCLGGPDGNPEDSLTTTSCVTR